MIKLYFVIAIITTHINGLLLSNNITNKPMKLFDILYDNDGWKSVESTEKYNVHTKKIGYKNLLAVMVSAELALSKKILQNVIMDVSNYEKFLVGSGNFISREIRKTDKFVDAYQFLSIDIPFFNNREYMFRMFSSGYNSEDTTSIIHWFLLDEDVELLENEGKSATYLNYGAGLWVVEKKEQDKALFSYRIYIDPGGSIPDFLTDMINKTSIINIFKDATAEAQKRQSKSY